MVDSSRIAEAVADAVGRAATTLRPDVLAALRAAADTETSERGRAVLGQLIENAEIAVADRVPVCQDTGTVWVRVRIGNEEQIRGDLQAEVDEAVRGVYREHALRMSVCRDALFDRSNTGDNTPAFLELEMGPGTGARIDVLLKGGGSDNASALVMLPPSAGTEGVAEVVLDAVCTKGAGACPPLVIGVGVGTTFDRVAGLSKQALLREIGSAGDPRAAALEAELLARVNATGIGPGGLGGDTTALAVHVVTAPCHIASLPVAVSLGCCAMRSASVEL